MLSMKFLFSRCFTHAIISSSARLVKVVAIHSVAMAPSTPEVIVDWVFQLAYSIPRYLFQSSASVNIPEHVGFSAASSL